MQNIKITNLTQTKEPTLSYKKIKEKMLGKDFDLSVVFVGDARIKKLNNIYRGENKTTNILTFEISSTTGEIYLNLKEIKKEAKIKNLSFNKHLGFLFIHGILHLLGYKHSSKMERLEDEYCSIFNLV